MLIGYIWVERRDAITVYFFPGFAASFAIELRVLVCLSFDLRWPTTNTVKPVMTTTSTKTQYASVTHLKWLWHWISFAISGTVEQRKSKSHQSSIFLVPSISIGTSAFCSTCITIVTPKQRNFDKGIPRCARNKCVVNGGVQECSLIHYPRRIESMLCNNNASSQDVIVYYLIITETATTFQIDNDHNICLVDGDGPALITVLHNQTRNFCKQITHEFQKHAN